MGELVFAIILVLLFAGSVWLQIILSRMNNKWLGLIIPLVCFTFSIIIAYSLSKYTTEAYSVTEIDGVIIDESTVKIESYKPNTIFRLASFVPVFVISNISTFIFLAIYIVCREKQKMKNQQMRKQLNKMNIQDLE